MSHTSEPWITDGGIIYSGKSMPIARCAPDLPEMHDNARRIVACVNSLSHLDTEALEELERNGDKLVATSRYVDEARRERDELIALVEDLLKHGDFFMTAIEAKDVWSSDFEAWKGRAIETVARLKGGK